MSCHLAISFLFRGHDVESTAVSFESHVFASDKAPQAAAWFLNGGLFFNGLDGFCIFEFFRSAASFLRCLKITCMFTEMWSSSFSIGPYEPWSTLG